MLFTKRAEEPGNPRERKRGTGRRKEQPVDGRRAKRQHWAVVREKEMILDLGPQDQDTEDCLEEKNGSFCRGLRQWAQRMR